MVEVPARGIDLPLDARGTPFQQKVWDVLRAIPAGATVTYAELATRLGDPKASRAVAGACAANKLAVAIPCHRVPRADGSLPGYRWGVQRKRALIDRGGGVGADDAVSRTPAHGAPGFEGKIRSAPGPRLAYGALGMTPTLAANLDEDGGWPEDRDPARAFVMAELGRLVEAGGASMVTLESGMRELRLATGEIFHLGHAAITRIA